MPPRNSTKRNFDEGQADDLRAELAAVERAEERLIEGGVGPRCLTPGVSHVTASPMCSIWLGCW